MKTNRVSWLTVVLILIVLYYIASHNDISFIKIMMGLGLLGVLVYLRDAIKYFRGAE